MILGSLPVSLLMSNNAFELSSGFGTNCSADSYALRNELESQNWLVFLLGKSPVKGTWQKLNTDGSKIAADVVLINPFRICVKFEANG